jgi:hypothetical protein
MIFDNFCELLKSLRKRFKENKPQDGILSNSNVRNIVHDHKMAAIEERWGVFLKNLNFKTGNVLEDYERF